MKNHVVCVWSMKFVKLSVLGRGIRLRTTHDMKQVESTKYDKIWYLSYVDIVLRLYIRVVERLLIPIKATKPPPSKMARRIENRNNPPA